jgi:septal ring factor EnvC (AmiA/AmiB activator)
MAGLSVRAGIAALLLLGLPLGLSPGTLADDKADAELKQLEEKLAADRAAAAALAEREAEIAQEIAALTEQQVALAARAQKLEHDLTDVEATLAALNAELELRRAGLAAARSSLSQTLSALIQLALRPPEAALAETAQPIDAARAALLLGMLVPELEGRAARLGHELVALMELQAQIRTETDNAGSTTAALQQQKEALAALLARKETLAAITQGERQEAEARVTRMAAQAADLKELIAELERQEAERIAAERQAKQAEALRLETEARLKAETEAAAEREAAAAAEAAETQEAATETEQAEAVAVAAAPAPAPAVANTAQPQPTSVPEVLRDFPEDGGSGLAMPAAATLAAGWGMPLPDTGEASHGLLLETRPSAQVVATFDGRVVYAGPFRRYGLILILEHSGRYHSLLAGLGRIDVVLGQWVVAGEPVGLMTNPTEGKPALYLELRHNGQPIDPTPWFSTQLSKGEG